MSKLTPHQEQQFYDALNADDAFSAAITAQFGPKADRWTAKHNAYDASTKAAYRAKLQADKTWLDTMRAVGV